MKLNDFLDALVDNFHIGLMIVVGYKIYTINNDDLYILQDSWVDGLVADDVIGRRKNLREMDLTIKTIRSAGYKEDFIVIETINK